MLIVIYDLVKFPLYLDVRLPLYLDVRLLHQDVWFSLYLHVCVLYLDVRLSYLDVRLPLYLHMRPPYTCTCGSSYT